MQTTTVQVPLAAVTVDALVRCTAATKCTIRGSKLDSRSRGDELTTPSTRSPPRPSPTGAASPTRMPQPRRTPSAPTCGHRSTYSYLPTSTQHRTRPATATTS